MVLPSQRSALVARALGAARARGLRGFFHQEVVMPITTVRCRSCGRQGPVPPAWPAGVTPTICAPCFSLGHHLAVISGRRVGFVLPPCRCLTCRTQPWQLGVAS